MIPRQSPSAELLRLADLQAGVLSAEQVAGFGLGWVDVRGRCCPIAWQVASILVRRG